MNKLFDRSIDPEGLVLFSKADHLGRLNSAADQKTEEFLKDSLEHFHQTMEKPYVMGADLVAEGLKPGPYFSDILGYAHKLRLAGVDKENALRQTLAYAGKMKWL